MHGAQCVRKPHAAVQVHGHHVLQGLPAGPHRGLKWDRQGRLLQRPVPGHYFQQGG